MGRQDLFTKRLMENFFKVKCTLLQALRLRKGRTDHRGSRGIALPFLDHGTRSGWGVSVTPRPLFIPGKNPVPIVQEAGWAPGPVWTGAENLAPTGIRSPDRSARSQSLYRLSYPAHKAGQGWGQNVWENDIKLAVWNWFVGKSNGWKWMRIMMKRGFVITCAELSGTAVRVYYFT